MELEGLIKRLKDRLAKEIPINDADRHLLFWYDEEEAYVESVNNINISNLKILTVNKNNILKTKHILLKEDTESNFLIYLPYERPKNKLNWLLDIELYSQEFAVDRASMIAEDMGIDSKHKKFIKENENFFIERYQKRFKELYNINWSEEEFILGTLAVISKSNILNGDYIIREIISEGLDENNKTYNEIIKRLGEKTFWGYIEKEYGIKLEQNNLKNLIKVFFVNHMFSRLRKDVDFAYLDYAIGKKNSCYIFIEHWMKDSNKNSYFKEYAQIIEEELNIVNFANSLELSNLAKVNTFEIFDILFIKKVCKLIEENSNDLEEYNDLLMMRREITAWHNKYKYVYKAIIHAISLFEKIDQFEIIENNSLEIYNNYYKSYFKIDYEYRKFYYYFDRVNFVEELETIKDKVENMYINRYLNKLSEKWTDYIKEDILPDWGYNNILCQKGFKKKINKEFTDKNKKIFVIISDALRYEAGWELQRELNKEIANSEVEIEPMLGLVPSYTALGMAALIDGENLEYKDDDIFNNGISTKGINNRDKILKKLYGDAVAVSYKNIIGLNTKELRENYRNYKVVYIYHDTIDAIGDKEKSELKTFDAVEDAIRELKNLVQTLTGKLAVSNIYITSDHGFLYQRSKLNEYDKLTKSNINILGNGRRHIITDEDVNISGTLSVDLNYIFPDSNLKAIIPKGIMRYKMAGGGNNFVHGGVFLQEVVLPLIKFRNTKKSKNENKKVDIHLMNNIKDIVNTNIKLNFYQVDKVDLNNGILPRKLSVAFYDNDSIISEERIVLAEITSENILDREFSVEMILKNREYDRNKNYFLVIKDIENDEVLSKIIFKIKIGGN